MFQFILLLSRLAAVTVRRRKNSPNSLPLGLYIGGASTEGTPALTITSKMASVVGQWFILQKFILSKLKEMNNHKKKALYFNYRIKQNPPHCLSRHCVHLYNAIYLALTTMKRLNILTQVWVVGSFYLIKAWEGQYIVLKFKRYSAYS